MPDVVGSAIRTTEIWKRRDSIVNGWPLAYVAQDGAESIEIPWDEFDCLFLGGEDPWKDSKHAERIVKTALILKKHVHIGRVNSPKRFLKYKKLGAHTCDGSGVSLYDAMLIEIEKAVKNENSDEGFGLSPYTE